MTQQSGSSAKKIIIYIPGTGKNMFDTSLNGYATRFAKALDQHEEDRNYEYFTEMERYALHSDSDQETGIASIIRRNKEREEEQELVYKIYDFDYEDDFAKKFSDRNILIQSLLTVGAILRMVPVFVWALFRKGLSGRQKAQSIYFFLLLIFLSLFVFFLLPSLLALISDNIEPVRHYFKSVLRVSQNAHQLTWIEHCKSFLRDCMVYFKYLSHWSVPLASAVAILYPGFLKRITMITINYLSMHYYLKFGYEKAVLLGRLSELVERISETEKDYERIEIHGFGFGSVLALDLLYPKDTMNVSTCVRKEIKGLLTVACPHDFIRVYYPHFFKHRIKNVSSVTAWYNVASSTDVLSSNFRNDSKHEDGDPLLSPGNMTPVNVFYDVMDHRSVGFFDSIFLTHFKMHYKFWDKELSGSSFFTSYLNVKKERQLASAISSVNES